MSVNRTVDSRRVDGMRLPRPGHELLHLVDDGVELAGPGQQVMPGERHEAGSGDVLGQVAAVLTEVGEALGAGDARASGT